MCIRDRLTSERAAIELAHEDEPPPFEPAAMLIDKGQGAADDDAAGRTSHETREPQRSAVAPAAERAQPSEPRGGEAHRVARVRMRADELGGGGGVARRLWSASQPASS